MKKLFFILLLLPLFALSCNNVLSEEFLNDNKKPSSYNSTPLTEEEKCLKKDREDGTLNCGDGITTKDLFGKWSPYNDYISSSYIIIKSNPVKNKKDGKPAKDNWGNILYNGYMGVKTTRFGNNPTDAVIRFEDNDGNKRFMSIWKDSTIVGSVKIPVFISGIEKNTGNSPTKEIIMTLLFQEVEERIGFTGEYTPKENTNGASQTEFTHEAYDSDPKKPIFVSTSSRIMTIESFYKNEMVLFIGNKITYTKQP